MCRHRRPSLNQHQQSGASQSRPGDATVSDVAAAWGLLTDNIADDPRGRIVIQSTLVGPETERSEVVPDWDAYEAFALFAAADEAWSP